MRNGAINNAKYKILFYYLTECSNLSGNKVCCLKKEKKNK